MAASRGMEVTVLRPDGFELPEALVKRAQQAGAISGGSVRETSDRNEALAGANVLYAGSWSSTRFYGDRVEEKKLREKYTSWCVDDSWFANLAADPCYFMHALPVRRGVEIEDQTLDSPRSIVVRQAQNRMYAQMSVLLGLLG